MEQIEKNNMSIGSSSITLRFRNDILNKLKHEAAQKRISLNTLATQVFPLMLNMMHMPQRQA